MEALLPETTTFTSYSSARATGLCKRKVEQGHVYPLPLLFSSHVSRASSRSVQQLLLRTATLFHKRKCSESILNAFDTLIQESS